MRILRRPSDHFFVGLKETIKYLWAYRCAFCGKLRILTIHHIKPKHKWGEITTMSNLVPACWKCHKEIQPANIHAENYQPHPSPFRWITIFNKQANPLPNGEEKK